MLDWALYDLRRKWGLKIENGLTVSSGVHIYMHNKILKTFTSDSCDILHSPIHIKDNVYIFANSMVNKRMPIGHCS